VTQEKWQEAGLLRHIGIYAYRRAALEKFTQLTPSRLELLERLEQLRLLEQGVGYTVAIVQKAGVEVNTAEDLEKVRRENKA
jgi:3-deoxy-manno-octulosonate cytidylyltransferase (CMP-KDO synthetase)